ncbi:MAG: thioredoxin family protein [Bacteroidetes bacterium]|nr:thioredoxin family protein [Bacteroidota bacterium]
MKNRLLKVLVVLSLVLSANINAQKVVVNREVETEKDGKMLLGVQLREQFLKEPYAKWYNQEYQEYQTDKATLQKLRKKKINSYQMIAVVGTWCEDSHRDLPRLMKILDELKYPNNKLTILAVNRKRESPTGEEGLYNIQKVPTIIVYRYGKEIGRIIENPKSGWIERDLLEIVEKDNKSFKDLFKKDETKN